MGEAGKLLTQLVACRSERCWRVVGAPMPVCDVLQLVFVCTLSRAHTAEQNRDKHNSKQIELAIAKVQQAIKSVPPPPPLRSLSSPLLLCGSARFSSGPLLHLAISNNIPVFVSLPRPLPFPSSPNAPLFPSVRRIFAGIAATPQPHMKSLADRSDTHRRYCATLLDAAIERLHHARSPPLPPPPLLYAFVLLRGCICLPIPCMFLTSMVLTSGWYTQGNGG